MLSNPDAGIDLDTGVDNSAMRRFDVVSDYLPAGDLNHGTSMTNQFADFV